MSILEHDLESTAPGASLQLTPFKLEDRFSTPDVDQVAPEQDGVSSYSREKLSAVGTVVLESALASARLIRRNNNVTYHNDIRYVAGVDLSDDSKIAPEFRLFTHGVRNDDGIVDFVYEPAMHVDTEEIRHRNEQFAATDDMLDELAAAEAARAQTDPAQTLGSTAVGVSIA